MTAPRKLANSPTDQWLRTVADDKRLPIIHRFALLRFGLEPPISRVPDIIAAELGIGRDTILGAIDVAARRGYLFRGPGELITICGQPPPTEACAPAQAPSKDKRAATAPARACAARP